jgi:hypothetical protein
MKTLQEMREIVERGEAQFLTIEAARELKGKKIQTIYFGYAHQDGTDEFVVGDLVSEWEYYRNLKEDCYPDEKGYQNRTEYWASYMTPAQIKRSKEQLELTTAEGWLTYIRYTPEDDFENDHIMWCSDVDRGVLYIMAE